MRNSWSLITATFVATAMALSLVACNNNNDCCGAPIVGTAGIASGEIGFRAETAPLASFFGTGYSAYPVSASNLTLNSGWRNILGQAMGVCDREYYSGGSASCSAWMSGFNDIAIYFNAANPNRPRMVIRSLLPKAQSPYYDYYYSLPEFSGLVALFFGYSVGNPAGVFDPMVLDATVWPINDSQGFEIRAKGPDVSAAYNKLIKVKVPYGKMEDLQFSFNVTYSDGNGNNESQAGSGLMVRCMSPTCEY